MNLIHGHRSVRAQNGIDFADARTDGQIALRRSVGDPTSVAVSGLFLRHSRRSGTPAVRVAAGLEKLCYEPRLAAMQRHRKRIRPGNIGDRAPQSAI